MPLDRPPPKPFSSLDIPLVEWSDVPRFGLRWRHLSRAALGDDYRVGVAIEELPAGKQSAPAHYHIFEEEHVFVLEGALTLRLGAETFHMKAGDYVCFPAGQQAGHCLLNEGDAACRYVIVGEKNRTEVAVYTHSRKVLVRALGNRALFDLDATRSYFDGEDTGLPPGTPPHHAPVRIATEEPVKGRPPIASADVAWNEEGAGPVFGGQSKHLTFAALGGPNYHVGVLIEAPAPGMRLAPRHYHMLEEEHALILEGEVTLLLGEERFTMRPGDYACFPAGQKIGHSFLNSGTGPCRILTIGEQNPNEVIVYPDSRKIMVRALRAEDDIFDMSATRKYWDGEETG
jgi:uncharacterized cupin superfamily protein